MTESFEIRPARIEDADALGDFIKGLHFFSRLESQSLTAVKAQVRQELERCGENDSHSVYVSEGTGGRILGYVCIHWLPFLFLPGPEGYVSELFVAEAARGQGIGTQLLEVVKKEAKARGCSRLSLLNMRGRESYQRRFYAKAGWEERSDAANFVLDMRPSASRHHF